MNNLAVFRCKRVLLEQQLQATVERNSFAIDWDLKVAFFVCNRKLYSLNLHSDQATFLQDFIPHDGGDAGQEKDEIVCSNFLLEDKLYFVLLRSGKIVTYDAYNKEQFEHSVDVPALVDDAKFSHDQELFALATRDNQMLLFNKIMILQTSYDMNKDEYGTNKLVTLSWGSKSTQFHGEGMRDKRTVKEDYYPLNKWDDGKCTLDWRGDDNYFVVNFVCSKGVRQLKLFNRQGILQHTSEYVAGLEQHIAWKPSGTLIASTQTLPNKHSVIFFEKNGLKHGEFALPFDPNTFAVEQLAWSHDSEILLVRGYEIVLTSGDNYLKTRQSVMLYTQSNYYWYLKQCIQFDPPNYIKDLLWDEQDYSLLHLLFSQSTYYSRHYNKPVNTTEDGKVLVVDGNRLQVSDFERTLVPPPMSNYTVNFASQITQLCHSSSLLAVYLNGDQLVLLRSASAVTLKECDDLIGTISYNFSNVSSEFASVYTPIFSKKIERISEMILPVLLDDGRIFGLIDGKIVNFDYQHSEEICYLADISQPISALTILSERQLLLANASGQLFCYEMASNSLFEHSGSGLSKVPVYDDRPLSLWVHREANSDVEPHFICLTARNSLYYDHTLVLSCLVNSALLYRNKYLLFATTDSLFYCWPLQNFDAFQLNRAHPPRNLEKGSRIIAASSSQAKVVLQLPRGNLEAFHPRLLLHDQVEQYLIKLDFVRAFEILRKNRINLNYICDYDFDLFAQNCNLFLQQIGEHHLDWICLFLSELSSENVCHKLNSSQPEVKKIASKVDTVCELLREKMQQMDPLAYLNAILLTYIKKEKPQIDGALQVVKALPTSKLRDGAIKFLLYVVNVNRLFDEALGTYDFDILLMVASKSNKDPKEYISLVNSFKAIEDEHYRKYRIDLHLQRYRSALLHLSKCDSRFEEALELIEQRHLFKEAIEIYQLNQSADTAAKYSPIWNLYGNYLFTKKYYQEAAIAFKRAANYAQAFKSYLMDSNWNMASVCARQLFSAEDDFKKQMQPLAQQLVLNGNYVIGAYILENYLHEPREAFLTLVKGHEWDHAMRCFYDHQLEEALLAEQLLPELTASFESTMENIDDALVKLEGHLTRLKCLQESRLMSAMEGGGVEADTDIYSDTSSVLDSASVKSSESNQSTGSLKTNRSGRLKNKKRLEQRKYVLKSGSPNEDIQLVYAIKELIGRNGSLLSESRSLVATLYDRYMAEQSSRLQQRLQILHTRLVSAVDFIWNSDYFQTRLAEDEILRAAPKLETSTQWAIVLN